MDRMAPSETRNEDMSQMQNFAQLLSNTKKTSERIEEKIMVISTQLEQEDIYLKIFESIKLTQKHYENIESKLKDIDRVKELLSIPTKLDKKIAQKPTVENIDSYFDDLITLSNALKELSERNISTTVNTIEYMQSLRQTGIEKCLTIFNALLEKVCVVKNPNVLFEEKIIPTEEIENFETLLKMRNSFAEIDSFSYRNEIILRRSNFLFFSVNNLNKEKISSHDLVENKTKDNIIKALKLAEPLNSTSTSMYEKGSHNFVKYLEILSKMFNREIEFLSITLTEEDIEECAPLIFEKTLGFFYENAQNILKLFENDIFGGFVISDIFEAFGEFDELFVNIFEFSNDKKMIALHNEIITMYRKSILSIINGFENTVGEYTIRVIPTDGMVHPKTSEVVNFLKKSTEYSSVFDSILSGTYSSLSSNDNSKTSSISSSHSRSRKLSKGSESRNFKISASKTISTFISESVSSINIARQPRKTSKGSVTIHAESTAELIQTIILTYVNCLNQDVPVSDKHFFLNHIFMINNYHFIYQNLDSFRSTVSLSSLRQLKNSLKSTIHNKKSKLVDGIKLSLSCLTDPIEQKTSEGKEQKKSKETIRTIKDRLKTFNAAIAVLFQCFDTLSVYDDSLKRDLARTFANEVNKVYTPFCETYGSTITENREAYFVYSEQMLKKEFMATFKGIKSTQKNR